MDGEKNEIPKEGGIAPKETQYPDLYISGNVSEFINDNPERHSRELETLSYRTSAGFGKRISVKKIPELKSAITFKEGTHIRDIPIEKEGMGEYLSANIPLILECILS